MKKALDPRLRAALSQVQDPEMGIDVVRLGLIYGAWLDADGMARVTMTTTTRGCPLSAVLRESIAEAVLEVEGVLAAEVTLTYEPRWTTARIDAAGEDALTDPDAGEAPAGGAGGGWRKWVGRVFNA